MLINNMAIKHHLYLGDTVGCETKYAAEEGQRCNRWTYGPSPIFIDGIAGDSGADGSVPGPSTVANG